VLLWDIETRKLLFVAKENGDHVASLAVGHDMKHLASGDWDSAARFWKIEQARELESLNLETLPDGK